MQAWIQIGWLLPYPEEELGPQRGLVSAGERTKGSFCHGLLWAQWTCWRIYSRCRCLNAKIKGVLVAGVRCGVGPVLGLLTNTHWEVTVAISDCGNQGDQIQPYQTEIGSQCGSEHHDGIHECNESVGRECPKGNIILHWWKYYVFLNVSGWHKRSQSLSRMGWRC